MTSGPLAYAELSDQPQAIEQLIASALIPGCPLPLPPMFQVRESSLGKLEIELTG